MTEENALRTNQQGVEGAEEILWKQCVASCQEYLLKPKAATLFQVLNSLVGLEQIWKQDRSGPASHAPLDRFKDFEDFLVRGDLAAALETAEHLQVFAGGLTERAAVRFVLAGRALLIHREAELANDILTNRRAREDRGLAAFLDRFLFGIRCRISGRDNLAQLEELFGVSTQFGCSAIDEYVSDLLRFDNARPELLAFLLNLSGGLSGREREKVRGAALAVALRLGNMDVVDGLADPDGLPQNILTRVLPLSNYLESQGFPALWRKRKLEVQEFSALYRHFVAERALLSEEFSHEGRRIAIVGNSACETGRGRGAEIDSHDTVIRFNYFSADSRFHADYGRRVDIHARTGRIDPELRCRSVRIGRVLICEPNFLFVPHNWSRILELTSAGVKLACFPEGFHSDLQTQLNTGPSTGLAVIMLVKSLRGTSVSCFGFSFTDQLNGSATPTHYFDNSPAAMTHNWVGERRIFENLFSSPVPAAPATCPG